MTAPSSAFPFGSTLRRVLRSWGVIGGVVAAIGGCTPSPEKPPMTGGEASSAVTDQTIGVPPANSAQRPEDWFEDRTQAVQVNFRYSTGSEAQRFTTLETVGGGVGLIDYDRDQQVDLFCVGGGSIDSVTEVPTGTRCGLFRNAGTVFRDVTQSAGLDQRTDYSHGCVSGDVNRDGFPDLLVTCYGVNRLLLNLGDGTFVDATEEWGLAGEAAWHTAAWHTAAALGDVNRDGELDLLVTGYVDWKPSSTRQTEVPPPQDYQPVRDRLYLNTGDGRFVDASDAHGIRQDGMGLGVLAADLNGDQRVDFYVANDVVDNHLYLGTSENRLCEVGTTAGVAFNELGTPEGSMGVDGHDVNGDGRIDLFVTNFEREDNSLYLNLGEGQFQHSSAAFRLAGVARSQVKFGTGLRDFDGDNWPDLFVVSGHVRYRSGVLPFEQLPTLCRNDEGRGFIEITPQGGPWFRAAHTARGTATGDLDGDGQLDLVVSSLTEPVTLLYNRCPARNWIRLQLVGTVSPRTPIGSLVRVTALGRDAVFPMTSGAGYLSHSDERLLVALEADRELVELTVEWPSGGVERFTGLRVRDEAVLVEGRGESLKNRVEVGAGN